MDVAVLGTGIMGAGMARSMLREGLRVRVWNRTPEKARPLVEAGAEQAGSAAEAVRGADAIMTMLTDGPAVRAAMEAAAPGLSEGQVWMQSSTVGLHEFPALVRIAKDHGLVLVDAPVLGTRQPAEQGKLQVFAAGPDHARDVLKPVLEAVAVQTRWLADSADQATATKLKLVVNSWVLAVTTGVAEALSLAEGLGLDPALFPQVVSGGGLDSPYLQSKSAMILGRDLTPSFTAATAAKDARLIVEAAGDAGLTLDMADAVARRFARTVEIGHGEEDMAATYFASHDHDRHGHQQDRKLGG